MLETFTLIQTNMNVKIFMFVSDTVYKINEMGCVYVYLEYLSIDSSDEYDLKAYVDSYLSHDWDCSYYGFEK